MVAHDRYEQYRKKNVKEQTCINQYKVQAGPPDRNMIVAGRRVQTGAQAQKGWCHTIKK